MFNIGFSRNQHRLSPKPTHRLRPPSFRMARGLLQGSDGFTPRQSRVKWWRNPHHDSSQLFYSHGLRLTLVTHETACVPLARISLVYSPLARNLG